MHKKIIVGYVKVIIIYMSLSDYPVFDVDVVGSMVALLLAVIWTDSSTSRNIIILDFVWFFLAQVNALLVQNMPLHICP